MCTKMNQLLVSKTKANLLGGNTYSITYCHNSVIYFSI